MIQKIKTSKSIKILFIISILAVYFGFFAFDSAQMENFYINYAHFFVGICLSIWIYKSSQLFSKCVIFNFIKNNKYSLFFSFFLVIILFSSCKSDLRMLADETNLIGTSKGIFNYNKSILDLAQIKINDDYYLLKSKIDKRPLLYPFLLSIIHNIIGYSINNSYILNGICAFIILIIFNYLLNKQLGNFYGYISMFIVCSFPIFILCVTSSGFEVFNIYGAFIYFLAIYVFSKHNTAKYAEFLVYTSILFGYTRYEEAIFIFFTIIYVAYCLKKDEYNKFSIFFIIFPLLCLPIAWLNRTTYLNSNFEFGDNAKIFSIEYFISNFTHSIKFFLGLNSDYGMNKIIFLLSIAMLIILLIKHKYIKRIIFENKQLSTNIIIFILFHIVIRFCFIDGNLSKFWPTYRLGIIFIPIIAYLSSLYLYIIIKKYNLPKSVCIVFILSIFIYSLSLANNNRSYKQMPYVSKHKLIKKILKTNFPNKHDYVLVFKFSNFFSVYDYNVITPEIFNKNIDLFLKNKYWQYIIFIEDFPKNETNNKEKIIYNSIFNNNLNRKLLFSRDYFGGHLNVYKFKP